MKYILVFICIMLTFGCMQLMYGVENGQAESVVVTESIAVQNADKLVVIDQVQKLDERLEQEVLEKLKCSAMSSVELSLKYALPAITICSVFYFILICPVVNQFELIAKQLQELNKNGIRVRPW